MYSTTIVPRISETDAVGHINNTVPPVWLEAGRAGLFAEFRPDGSLKSWPLIVKTYALTFDRELMFGADVVVECRVARLGNTSLTLHESIVQGGAVCVTGEVVYINVGADRRPAPIPADIRSRLEAHMNEVSHD